MDTIYIIIGGAIIFGCGFYSGLAVMAMCNIASCTKQYRIKELEERLEQQKRTVAHPGS